MKSTDWIIRSVMLAAAHYLLKSTSGRWQPGTPRDGGNRLATRALSCQQRIVTFGASSLRWLHSLHVCLFLSLSFFIIGALPVIYSLNWSPRKVSFLVATAFWRPNFLRFKRRSVDGLECHQACPWFLQLGTSLIIAACPCLGLPLSMPCNSIQDISFLKDISWIELRTTIN